jgi:membrane protease YdiL (CAAX protease family)
VPALAIARGQPARAVGVALFAIALEWGRALALRSGVEPFLALLLGGAALCLLAVGWRPSELGLGRSELPLRLLGGVALAAVLLLPAAVRWSGAPAPLAPNLALAAVFVSAGEEVAFRGALFRALEQLAGPATAVAGSTLAFTAAHALSHPPAFLVPVAAAGLLLGLWRWACKDLVAPLTAHVLADLAL